MIDLSIERISRPIDRYTQVLRLMPAEVAGPDDGPASTVTNKRRVNVGSVMFVVGELFRSLARQIEGNGNYCNYFHKLTEFLITVDSTRVWLIRCMRCIHLVVCRKSITSVCGFEIVSISARGNGWLR